MRFKAEVNAHFLLLDLAKNIYFEKNKSKKLFGPCFGDHHFEAKNNYYFFKIFYVFEKYLQLKILGFQLKFKSDFC